MTPLDTIIERDGGVCVWCGREPSHRELCADHLMPRSRGGRTSVENLVVSCRPCDKRRGTRPIVAFVRDQLQDGVTPRCDLLSDAVERLADSSRRDLADYGRRQKLLLARLVETVAPGC